MSGRIESSGLPKEKNPYFHYSWILVCFSFCTNNNQQAIEGRGAEYFYTVGIRQEGRFLCDILFLF